MLFSIDAHGVIERYLAGRVIDSQIAGTGGRIEDVDAGRADLRCAARKA